MSPPILPGLLRFRGTGPPREAAPTVRFPIGRRVGAAAPGGPLSPAARFSRSFPGPHGTAHPSPSSPWNRSSSTAAWPLAARPWGWRVPSLVPWRIPSARAQLMASLA